MDNPFIVHVIDELRVGGAQTHLLTRLEEERKRKGIRHKVICLFAGATLTHKLRDLGVESLELDFSRHVQAKNFIPPLWSLKKIFDQDQPTHVEAHLTWSRVLALPAAWLSGVPNRYSFEHGDIYLTSPGMRLLNFTSQFFTDEIICCSEALRAWFNKANFTYFCKTSALHVGINLEQFSVSKNAQLRAQWNFPDNTFVFCAAGTMGRGVNKRFDVILKAFAKLQSQVKSVGIVICGDGEQRQELEQLAQKLGIYQSVRFLGLRSDVNTVMASSDAFCHAAPFEPFGLVIVEAMLSGLPVIVPKAGGPVEIIDQGNFGLFYAPLSVDELTEKMRVIIENGALRKKLVSEGKRHVEQNFLIKGYVDKVYAKYEI